MQDSLVLLQRFNRWDIPIGIDLPREIIFRPTAALQFLIECRAVSVNRWVTLILQFPQPTSQRLIGCLELNYIAHDIPPKLLSDGTETVRRRIASQGRSSRPHLDKRQYDQSRHRKPRWESRSSAILQSVPKSWHIASAKSFQQVERPYRFSFSAFRHLST